MYFQKQEDFFVFCELLIQYFQVICFMVRLVLSIQRGIKFLCGDFNSFLENQDMIYMIYFK